MNKEKLFEDTTINALNSLTNINKTVDGEVVKIDRVQGLQTSINNYFKKLFSSSSSENDLLDKVILKLTSMVDDLEDPNDLLKIASLLLANKSKNIESITGLFKSTGQDKSMIDLLDRKQDDNNVEKVFNKIESSADLKTMDDINRKLNDLASRG